MKPRMLCTDCFQTAEADTVLEGSDHLEMLGWCCLVLPGLLYCWWRHALRIKVCAYCGGGDLVREARAARARQPLQAPPAWGSRVRNLSGPSLWPRAFGTPRDRLRHGAVAALLAVVLAVSGSLAQAAPAAGGTAASAATWGAAAAWGVWLAYQLHRLSQLRATLPGCRAWDEHGRALRIERIA